MWIRGKASLTIAATPEAIWEWLVDREKQERWLKDEMEWLPADRSQLRAGYRGTEIMRMPHGPSEAHIELLEYDPPRRMVVRQEHDMFKARAVFELNGGPGGTRVHSSIRIRYRKLTTWLALLPIVPFYGRVIKRGLEELKQLVETGA